MLRVIHNKRQIASCQRRLESALPSKATESKRHLVGFPGGKAAVIAHYVKSLNFWMGFERAANRFFNPAGIGNPFDVTKPAPHLEINVPFSGINRRVAGAFAEDEDGACYVVHSGKVGGGAKGVSLRGFLEYYPASSAIDWGGHEKQVYVPKTVETKIEYERDFTEAELDHIRTFGELGQQTLERVAKDSARNDLVVQHYKDNAAEYGKTIVFAVNTAHVMTWTKTFCDAGVDADYVTYNRDRTSALIDSFKRTPSPVVLSNVQILAEGAHEACAIN